MVTEVSGDELTRKTDCRIRKALLEDLLGLTRVSATTRKVNRLSANSLFLRSLSRDGFGEQLKRGKRDVGGNTVTGEDVKKLVTVV